MKSRLFVGNFDFEHDLAMPGKASSRHVQRINAELATSWLAVADDGDEIWTPEPIPEEFWQGLSAQGLPQVRGVTTVTPRDGRELIPWGWTSALQKQSTCPAPPMSIVRAVNSRRWSAAREAAWNAGLALAKAATNLDEAAGAVGTILKQQERWIIKAELGMSGRERILGTGPLDDQDCNWITRRLKADGVVFVEPWVDAVTEAGLQFEIPPVGPLEFLGVTEMLPSARGQYAGSVFIAPSDRATCDWSVAIDVATRAATELQAAGYFGPVGIDAMWYRRSDGDLACRPLQDVNARWTMGRLALGWRRRFRDASLGYWWHGSAGDVEALRHLDSLRCGSGISAAPQVIRTSSQLVGSEAAQHVSALILA